MVTITASPSTVYHQSSMKAMGVVKGSACLPSTMTQDLLHDLLMENLNNVMYFKKGVRKWWVPKS